MLSRTLRCSTAVAHREWRSRVEARGEAAVLAGRECLRIPGVLGWYYPLASLLLHSTHKKSYSYVYRIIKTRGVPTCRPRRSFKRGWS